MTLDDRKIKPNISRCGLVQHTITKVDKLSIRKWLCEHIRNHGFSLTTYNRHIVPHRRSPTGELLPGYDPCVLLHSGDEDC
jgi:hypothetical protein